jgi:hypothetical protein
VGRRKHQQEIEVVAMGFFGFEGWSSVDLLGGGSPPQTGNDQGSEYGCSSGAVITASPTANRL